MALEDKKDQTNYIRSLYHLTNQDPLLDPIKNDAQAVSLKKILQAFFREKILSFKKKKNQLIFDLPITNYTIYVNEIKFGSLDRLVDIGQIFICETGKENSKHQITDPLELLKMAAAELQNVSDSQAWKKLVEEVADHLRNAVLANYKTILLNNSIANEAKNKNYKSFLEWLKNNKNISNKELFIEQWASQGHPYHPCSKTKLGLSADEIIQYSPEFHPNVPLVIAAINKEYVHVESMKNAVDFTKWFSQQYPTTWLQWQRALNEKKLASDQYLPMPIHPWQAKKIIPSVFKEFIAKNIIHLLDQVVIESSPTLSFRTMAPLHDQKSAYIKLPVAIQATSTFRTLSMGSTENTPRVSQLLTDIFAQEKCFSDRLYLLRGLYGLHLKQVTPEQGKHLSVIFRENIHLYLAADEIGVVIAGLFSISPISGLSLFVEQLEAAGATTLKSALDYFKYYVNLLLTSYLDLYLIYGITLEGHQQNTLAVFHHGKITRFVARDFADTDIHLPTLKRRGFDIKPYPGSAYITDDLDQVRKPLIHAVYRLHLGGLVLLLAKHFNCNEDYFWKIIRDITIERFEFVKNKMDTATWQTEYHAILQDDWLGKALLSMRLEKEGAPMGVSFEMDNPLKKLERK